MDSKELNQQKDLEILKRLCKEEGVKFKMVQDLIQTEKKSQLGSRHGVFNDIEDIIESFSES